jgi:hypothetical protein
LREHGAPKDVFEDRNANIEESDDDDQAVDDNNGSTRRPTRSEKQVSPTTTQLRRSSRIRNKSKTVTNNNTITTASTTSNIINDNINNEEKKNVVLSSLLQHAKDTNHRIDWSNFRVVWQDNNSYKLLIKESLLIQAFQPELNRTTHSVPLIVYPDGLPRNMLPDANG